MSIKDKSDRELLEAVFQTVGGLATDVNDLQKDVSGLKSDMVEVKSDVSTLKSDMVEVKADVSTLKSDMVEVKRTLSSHSTVLDAIAEILRDNHHEITSNTKRIEVLEKFHKN